MNSLVIEYYQSAGNDSVEQSGPYARSGNHAAERCRSSAEMILKSEDAEPR